MTCLFVRRFTKYHNKHKECTNKLLPNVIGIWNIKIVDNFTGEPNGSKVSVRSRSNWNLEMLVFVEGGKPENPEKNPRSKDENQQQTQPPYDSESGHIGGRQVLSPLCHPCSMFGKVLIVSEIRI